MTQQRWRRRRADDDVVAGAIIITDFINTSQAWPDNVIPIVYSMGHCYSDISFTRIRFGTFTDLIKELRRALIIGSIQLEIVGRSSRWQIHDFSVNNKYFDKWPDKIVGPNRKDGMNDGCLEIENVLVKFHVYVNTFELGSPPNGNASRTVNWNFQLAIPCNAPDQIALRKQVSFLFHELKNSLLSGSTGVYSARSLTRQRRS